MLKLTWSLFFFLVLRGEGSGFYVLCGATFWELRVRESGRGILLAAARLAASVGSWLGKKAQHRRGGEVWGREAVLGVLTSLPRRYGWVGSVSQWIGNGLWLRLDRATKEGSGGEGQPIAEAATMVAVFGF
ncbi:hypothetical protein BX600DRAFT_11426 [Xylariales sp. PMI_506]|nr:hypothetical protein BX600DRAFT_11426 [Xylariales sp. PMI_506]